jgi:hypothetical protein
MKLFNFFRIKKRLLSKKGRFFPKNFGKLCFYGLDTELEPEPEPEPKPEPLLVKSRNRKINRNRSLSKVGTGTGTVKNSYGSATLEIRHVGSAADKLSFKNSLPHRRVLSVMAVSAMEGARLANTTVRVSLWDSNSKASCTKCGNKKLTFCFRENSFQNRKNSSAFDKLLHIFKHLSRNKKNPSVADPDPGSGIRDSGLGAF